MWMVAADEVESVEMWIMSEEEKMQDKDRRTLLKALFSDNEDGSGNESDSDNDSDDKNDIYGSDSSSSTGCPKKCPAFDLM